MDLISNVEINLIIPYYKEIQQLKLNYLEQI